MSLVKKFEISFFFNQIISVNFHTLIKRIIASLWSPAGKELTPWLLFVMFNCVFVTFPCGILGSGEVLDCIDSRFLSPFLLYLP